jgi:hypothetical protein
MSSWLARATPGAFVPESSIDSGASPSLANLATNFAWRLLVFMETSPVCQSASQSVSQSVSQVFSQVFSQ